MTALWIDAQLPPALASWIEEAFAGISAVSVRRLGLRDATDAEIFEAARAANAVVLTKDADFSRLLMQFGPPPRVVWLTFGDTSNEALRRALTSALPDALALIGSGEALVEVRRASR